MDQECQQYDDTYDKISFDILVLRDKVRGFKKRNRETPLYHISAQWRLYKELRNISRQTDEIGERLKRIEDNPVQIVKRI